MGRSLLRARDAAVQYLAASEDLSERVRRGHGRGAPTVALALQAVDRELGAVRRALTTNPMGEVAVAELGAAAHEPGGGAARPPPGRWATRTLHPAPGLRRTRAAVEEVLGLGLSERT